MHVQFNQGLIAPQREQLGTMLNRFYNEHLVDAINGNRAALANSVITFCSPDTLHVTFRETTMNSEIDRIIIRETVRYLELSAVPLVLFDESPLMLEIHDEDRDENGNCRVCKYYTDRLMPVDVNSTTLAQTRNFIGA